MTEIVCDLNGYALKKKIWVFDEDNEKVLMHMTVRYPEMSNRIKELAEEWNVYNVRIFGNNKQATLLGLALSDSKFYDQKTPFIVKFNNEE